MFDVAACVEEDCYLVNEKLPPVVFEEEPASSEAEDSELEMSEEEEAESEQEEEEAPSVKRKRKHTEAFRSPSPTFAAGQRIQCTIHATFQNGEAMYISLQPQGEAGKQYRGVLMLHDAEEQKGNTLVCSTHALLACVGVRRADTRFHLLLRVSGVITEFSSYAKYLKNKGIIGVALVAVS